MEETSNRILQKSSKMTSLPSTSPHPSPPSPAALSVSKSKVSSIPQWILLLLFLSPSSSTDISYADHCASVISSSNPTTDSAAFFPLSAGYFSGGDRFLGQETSTGFSIPRSFAFYTRSVHRTETPGTFQLAGTLIFRGGGVHFAYRNLTGRSLRLVRPWQPRSFNQRGRLSFDLSGFWSEETGKLCMVGSGTGRSKEGTFLYLSAVFKLKYPSSSNITSSVVSGNLESLDSVDSPNYFDPIRVLAYAQKKYEYTKLSEARKSCTVLDDSGHESMGFLDMHQSICDVSSNIWRSRLKLEHGSSCTSRKCGPLSYNLGLQPALLRFTLLECAEDGSFRAVMMFSNHSGLSSSMMLDPGMSMVAEGTWDQAKNQLCLLACRVNNVVDAVTDNAVDDCTIGVSLAFPAFLTIESRNTIVGRIWSYLNETDPGYFESVLFKSFGYNSEHGHGLRYKYTMTDVVRKSCKEKDVLNKPGKKRYPDPRNYRDLMFYLLMRTSEGKLGSGFANPIALDETIYHYPSLNLSALVDKNESIWNISYSLTQQYHQFAPFNIPEAEDIPAEGIYNAKTGMICMVGCRSSSSGKQEKNADSKDCSILINIQIPPLNPERGEHLNGIIRSRRAKWDPLFFEPLEISSHVMYRDQAVQSIWRMELEVIMVLISLTFSCIFVGLQLFHTNKHPEVLPSISITMLTILTLGHMIHLVLNFKSFSKNHNRQNFQQSNEGWLEENEVVVRLMTMSVFLLHFRLLQVAWSSRSAYEGKNSLWLAERRTIQLCLTIYIAGGFIAWFVHLNPHKTLHQVPHVIVEANHSYLEDMQSYVGLILDGFLFPQLIFNVFCTPIGRSLAPTFYIGTTIVRALPHVYDAYRSNHYVPYLSSYIYARTKSDLYSLAWDIIIPCGGLLFAAVIYIQQRFGSIFCRRIQSPGVYEMVPVAPR